MNRIVLIPVVVVSVVLVPLIFVGASARNRPVLRVNPKTGNYRPITKEEQKDDLERAGKLAPEVPPKAVVPSTEFDFEIMDPEETDQHIFLIRNEGAGPLKLRGAGTSCQCTEFKILDYTIPPGGAGRIAVQWNVYEPGQFLEKATIRTNDPALPKIDFVVRGEILYKIAAFPFQLDFPRVMPGKAEARSVLIFSQKWDQFAIEDVHCTLPGMTWQFETATPEDLADHEATSGHKIVFTVPSSLERGRHSHRIRLQIRPNGEESETFEFGNVITVLRRVALYGKSLRTAPGGAGEVELGNLRPGDGKILRLLMKCYDEDRDLSGMKISTTPDFLQVRVIPHDAAEAKEYGLYNLEIEVPKSAPEGIYRGLRSAKVNLKMNHPRIEDIELDVVFSVVDDRPEYAR